MHLADDKKHEHRTGKRMTYHTRHLESPFQRAADAVEGNEMGASRAVVTRLELTGTAGRTPRKDCAMPRTEDVQEFVGGGGKA